MSYLYATPGSTAANTAANAGYPHSPYAGAQQVQPSAQGLATMPSPYGQPQTASGVAYPGSTMTTQSTLGAPASTYPGQPSPMVGQVYLPSGGQLTVGSTAASAMSAPTTPAQPTQPFSGNVAPGAVTYTTTTDALGRVTYHHFKAQSAVYRSPQGVTYTGIQWVPTETSSVPPVGIPQAGPDVLASFRGQLPIVPQMQPQTAPTTPAAPNPALGLDYRDDTRGWEKDERRRRREEKRRNAAWEAGRLARERAEEEERAQELDERASRMRRPSYGAGLGADRNAGPYERERSRVRGGDPLREREREERELERRMGDLDVSGRDGYYGEYGAPGTRSRRQSVSARAAPGGIYDESAYDRDSDEYGGYRKRDPSRHRSGIYAAPEQSLDAYGPGDRSRPASIYGAPRDRSRPSSMYAPERSPYRRDTAPLQPTIGPDGVEVYPPGHILAGQPVSGSGFASSRNPSPNLRPAPYPSGLSATSPRVGMMGSAISPRVGPGAFPGASPRMGGGMALAGAGIGGYGASQQVDQLLPAPEAFNRPINRAQTFTPFKDIRVQDLDELLDDVIRPMPPVLSTHDVLPEDWGRLMHDMTLAWKGRLPLPLDKPTKRSDLVIDLLDLWNSMFFNPRWAELVLYKGRHCRSGPGAGLPETRLLPEQLFSPSEFQDDEDDESDDESDEGEYGADPYDRYGGGHHSGSHHAGSHGRRHGHGLGGRSQSQRRGIARAAKKKQRIEEKVQREMEANKKYTLWLRYVEPREREY